MAKMGKKAAKMGFKSKTVGDAKDGARPSVKHQVSGKLAANKVGTKGRAARVSKMESMDPSC